MLNFSDIYSTRPITHHPTHNNPRVNKSDSGINHLYKFTHLLHRFIPRHQFFQNIRICKKLHTWKNGQQQLKILENIKPVRFSCVRRSLKRSSVVISFYLFSSIQHCYIVHFIRKVVCFKYLIIFYDS